jgi:hypothetical protein
LTSHKFVPVYKDRLFYNRFEYCLGFYLSEASCLRMLDHAMIDDIMQRRRQYHEIAQQRWVNNHQQHGIIVSRRWKEITEKTISDLHNVADHLLNAPAEFKLVVSIDQGWIYTNDTDLIDTLSQTRELSCLSYTQAVITRPKDTVQLKKSRYQFRSYFKLLKLTWEQKHHLENFLTTQKDHVRLSPALQRWIDQPFNRIQDYYFVDHDSKTWLTMLSLVQPGIIRKTVHIIPAK